ncbi:MAG: hypothetical protein IJH95_03860 [Mogibacterium sp.]|nr:hypothetical protein [Mogibacterium sp.]
MKEDRVITLLGVLTGISGLLACSVGKWIMGGIMLLLAFAIFMNRGGGKFNDRSIYEKVIKTDLSIDELFAAIKDMDTPLGRAWIAVHKGFAGDSIIFGPNRYKDCVVISRKKGDLDVKHITMVDNIIRGKADEYRFSDFIDAKETEVTPMRYSYFAAFKLASVMMIRDLTRLIEKLDADKNAAVPESIGTFSFYYHNSTEGFFRDAAGDDILVVRNSYHPFEAKVFDTDGNEMASVVPRAYNAKDIVTDSAGFDMYADGELFGDISRTNMNGADAFIAKTEAGEFTVRIIPANRRANMSFNYVIEKDGVEKAVIGGSPNILFDTVGRCQNDVILSYDDDYLVFYAVMEVFIMTLNKRFLK